MELNEGQLDALTELVNIGVGRAASSLSELISSRIQLSVPEVSLCGPCCVQSLLSAINDPASTIVSQDFEGMISGRAGLLFEQESGLKLSSMLAGYDEPANEIDVELNGILLEVGNIVLNGVMGSLSNMLETQIAYSVPHLSSGDKAHQALGLNDGEEKNLMISKVNFSVESSEIEGSIMVVFSIGSVERILDSVLAA